eukprot:gene6669-3334_t
MEGGSSFSSKYKKWTPRLPEVVVVEADDGDEGGDDGDGGGFTMSHPRSQALKRVLPDPDRNFKLLAQVADTNPDQQGNMAARGQANCTAECIPCPSLQVADTNPDQQGNMPAQEAKPPKRKSEDMEGGNPGEDGSNILSHLVSPQFLTNSAAAAAGSFMDLSFPERCALCKLHVEIDRNEAAREEGYFTAST